MPTRLLPLDRRATRGQRMPTLQTGGADVCCPRAFLETLGLTVRSALLFQAFFRAQHEGYGIAAAAFMLPETEFAVQGDAGSVVAQGLPVHGGCAQFAKGALQQ